MIASTRIGWVASMNPVGVKFRNPDRWPSWKIQTSAPNEAPIDSTFMISALTGSTTEPKARNSSTNVVATTISAIHGSSAPRLSSRSVSTALCPPTSTVGAVRCRHVADVVDQRPRLLRHRVAVVGDRHAGGLPGGLGHGRAVHTRAPRPPRRRRTAARHRRRRSRPRRAASRSPRSDRTGPRGKSDLIVSATTRLSVPAGRARSSIPPNCTRRNGRASADQHGDDDHRVDDRAPHDALRDAVPGAVVARRRRGGAVEDPAQPRPHRQRVHLRAEHRQQGRQQGEGGQHRDEDGAHPAEAHRAQEDLREDQQTGQRDRHRDPGDRHRPAGGRHRAGHGVLDASACRRISSRNRLTMNRP